MTSRPTRPLRRSSGVLLHPTSLPGHFGSGDLGRDSRRFLDWLEEAGQTAWQVLPLGPTGWGDSPYSGLSAFALSPLLVDLEELADRGWLERSDLETPVTFAPARIEFGAVREFRFARLKTAADRFRSAASKDERTDFERWGAAEAFWLDDYALFQALMDEASGALFSKWERRIVERQPAAIIEAKERLAPAIEAHRFVQWSADRQWRALKGEAAKRGIRLFGDLPIFVAEQSADVWSHPELFELDAAQRPTVVAGVPPDYFSRTGQRWGNPLYRWSAHEADDFAWWVRRVRALFRHFDLVRLDHFRGFIAHWEIPAKEPTAVHGRWVPGPGAALFRAIERALGHVAFVAEDLGVITPEVEALRDELGFPGMKILQFAFGDGASNPFLPHNFRSQNCVAYSGTHDNDTAKGWWKSLSVDERARVIRYAGGAGRGRFDVSREMTRLVLSSVAELAILPMQDLLGLGSEARMNRPGRKSGNWAWRFRWDDVPENSAAALREMVETYGRGRREHAVE